MSEPRRLPLVIAGAALLAGVSVLAGGKARLQAPNAVSLVALSSTWSCAGTTAGGGSLAPGQLVIDDAGATPLKASVRLVAQDGESRSIGLSVQAGGGVSVPESFAGRASGEWAAALVELYGGMGSVYQEVHTRTGSSMGACSPAASPDWYFAGGSVLRNAALELSLVNPYPAAAVVDVSFATNEGEEQPLALQGVVVPARGLAVMNVGAALRQRLAIATMVTARTGEVVAWETERVARPPRGAALPRGADTSATALNPALPVPGVALTLGSREESRSWWWADGGEPAGVTETYDVYNPGTAPAHVNLELFPGGKGTGSNFSWTVGPASLSAMTTNGHPWALPGVAYAAHVTSTVPVVAVRSVQAGAPSPVRGIASQLGLVQGAKRWLVAGGSDMEAFSASGGPVFVFERMDGHLQRTEGVSLAANGHVSFLLPGASHTFVVEGSAPIMVSGEAVALRQS